MLGLTTSMCKLNMLNLFKLITEWKAPNFLHFKDDITEDISFVVPKLN